MKLFKKAKKGFTLVELVVVIAVIAILAGVSVGAYFGITATANNSKAEQEAKAIHTALLTVASDPENGYSLSNNGLKLGSKTEENLIDAIEEVTGISYNVVIDTVAQYPQLDFAAPNEAGFVTTFTYKIISGGKSNGPLYVGTQPYLQRVSADPRLHIRGVYPQQRLSAYPSDQVP